MGKSSRAGDPPRSSVSKATRLRSSRSQGGFTLAGVLVLVSIVMIFVAYTVPQQWSAIMQRERELQTIYVMRQYARACNEFQRKHTVWPTSIDQLKEARLPRFIRGGPKSEFLDPLTGELDWLIIPAAAAAQGQTGTIAVNGPGGTLGVARGTPGTAPGGGGATTTDTSGTAGGTPQPPRPGLPPEDQARRPPARGRP